MDTSFNLENFISNLASLARRPFDPEALPDLLEQVTGHRWERSASTSTSAASASASASAPSVPSAPSASTPHLAAAAAAAAAGGGGDARQEEYKSKTKTDTTNHEDDSLETTTIADPLTTSGPSSSAAAAAINDNDTDVDEDDDFDVDDDHTAFKSCTSHDNSGHHLYDQPDPHRFPNGNLCYAVNDPTSTFNTSWVMLLATSKKGKGQNKDKRYYYHSCLGIYECPVKGCKFVSNPAHPRKKKIGARPTKARGSGDCKIHNKQLVHVPCNAKMNLRKSSNSSVVARTNAERFYKTVEEIRKDFPLLKDWINWYVTNNIERCFFSAVSNGSIKGFGKDTNAQEGTGRWLKSSDHSSKPSICSCIKYLYLRGRLIQQDMEAEKEGRQSRYRRGGALNPIDRDADSEAKNKRSQQRATSRKRAYENDGRVPDTEALLTPPKKRAKIGRRTGSTNKAPRGNDIVDRSFGIPWSYKNNGAVVSNTCSMDSVLMLLYMLRKFSSLPQEIFADDEVLTKVLNQIEIGQFDAARIYWISELTAKFGDSVFNSMTDLDCDASVHSAASSLFQMGVLTEYDECQLIQENCPHYCDYINVPGIRGSGMTTESFLYLGNGNTYGSLQQYFDCQHNGFGMLSSRSKSNNNNVEPRLIATEPCGTNIVLEGRKPGCTGKRMQRKVIQHHPRILEVVIPKTTDGSHPVTKPSHIEHSLTINKQKYKFVGAVLYGGNGRSGHYQSLFFIGGKFATYDGMLAKNKNKIVWIKEDENFRAAFHAAKLWYVPLTDFGGVEVHAGVGVPTFDFKIGVPYGLLFGLKRNIGKVKDDHCEECNEFFYPYNPCLMARDKMGDGEAQVIQYFHLHCCSQRFKSRASEVFDAVDVCSFPNSAKVELRKMLVGDFHASNQVSSIDVEGILCAGMERNHNQIGVGQQWFNSLPPGEQRVVKEGVDAVMYGGCMAAAMKAFDNVVRENAREALNPDGDNNPAALDNAVLENTNAREENIRAPTPDGDKKPAATQKHNLEVEDNNNEEKGVEIAREERIQASTPDGDTKHAAMLKNNLEESNMEIKEKEIGIGTSSSSSSSVCSKTLSELYAEWDLDLEGNFPVLTIEAADSITHWNNAVVGDRFHQRT
eukprot:scaffold1084_cov166-Skeletonema_marinoi.AAC.1